MVARAGEDAALDPIDAALAHARSVEANPKPSLLELPELLLRRRAGALVLDVRSPSEYARGHVPGAVNLPALDDAERAEVGTLWARVDPARALARAEELGRAKLDALLEQASALRRGREEHPLLVHCWRGGLRSARVAEELASHGLSSARLRGGYKVFRRWALARFDEPRALRVVCGPTGSGKTAFLHERARAGEAVLDLEALAHHKGSAFGHLGETPQPTQEQFENELALAWDASDPARELWIEDESRNIGKLLLPERLYAQMQGSPVHVLDVPRAERVAQLVATYGDADREALAACFRRIEKRCGRERTQRALVHLAHGELAAAVEIVLDYYDKAYAHSTVQKRCQAP
ncbi:MAG: tRNA 2-selenouridine(34) synthase MnmH [Planctomycetes bacterium]|nr:tRNA 2-selenouridine(34) synthase MnmH [Planctomycetota bacterium]